VTHFTPQEFVDAAEGTLAAGRLGHLEQCETCRRQVGALVALMREAADAPVPEPSPLFWEHFSARVRDAVRQEAAPVAPRWAGWLRWPTLVPLGALAALVMALVTTIPRSEPPLAPPAGADLVGEIPGAAAGDAGADLDWRALADLVGPLDWETAGEAGLTLVPGDAELAAMELNDDERRELTRLIAGELARAKS
jgi:hypothetical protein